MLGAFRSTSLVSKSKCPGVVALDTNESSPDVQLSGQFLNPECFAYSLRNCNELRFKSRFSNECLQLRFSWENCSPNFKYIDACRLSSLRSAPIWVGISNYIAPAAIPYSILACTIQELDAFRNLPLMISGWWHETSQVCHDLHKIRPCSSCQVH